MDLNYIMDLKYILGFALGIFVGTISYKILKSYIKKRRNK